MELRVIHQCSTGFEKYKSQNPKASPCTANQNKNLDSPVEIDEERS